MARSRLVTRVGRGARRQTTWVGPADQGGVGVAAGGATIIQSFDPIANAFAKPTVVRTRGAVTITPSTFGADINIHGAYGVGIVSDQAFAAGIASIPEPFDEAGWDGWFVWRSFQLTYEFHDATGSLLGQLVHEVDSKAMRKVTDNETIVMVAQSQAGAFNISMHLRTLFKLA